jgi:hypothetical protein
MANRPGFSMWVHHGIRPHDLKETVSKNEIGPSSSSHGL